MYKVLLADDEPLVLVGLQGMLQWADYDVTIVGTARTGSAALEMINTLAPDIVITDIKMPVKTGLEVMKEIHDDNKTSPLFIMLTSYEEFSFAQEAIRLGAVDYLVKLELTAATLGAALTKAIDRVKKDRKPQAVTKQTLAKDSLAAFHDKMFMRLYNNLFESKDQFLRQTQDFGIKLNSERYCAVYCEIVTASSMETQKLMQLYAGTIEIVRDTVTKYLTSYITSLDMRHFVICFCKGVQDDAVVATALEKAIILVKNYFSVELLCALGNNVNDAFLLSESYRSARSAFTFGKKEGLLFVPAQKSEENISVFNMTTYKTSLTRAFNELDADALENTITEIVQSFDISEQNHTRAMDAACSLLYMAISLLPDGEKNVEQIFDAKENGYRRLYNFTRTDECCSWMIQLRDGLCNILRSRKQSYKERIVLSVQEYLKQHLSEKLSLNEVAAAFSFSPNYLSSLFAQYTEGGFVEYITEERVSAAKAMMAATDKKIYEISEELGFESAFYFSKVFKKVTGQSPREYMQSKK